MRSRGLTTFHHGQRHQTRPRDSHGQSDHHGQADNHGQQDNHSQPEYRQMRQMLATTFPFSDLEMSECTIS